MFTELVCAATIFLFADGTPRQPDKVDLQVIELNRCSLVYKRPMCTKQIILKPNGHRHIMCSEPERKV